MTKLKKILVAYDGSAHSKEALNWAIDFSLLSGAEVAAVKVFELFQLYPLAEVSGDSFIKALDEMRRKDQQLMDEAAAVGQKSCVKVTGQILQGNITEAIISYAKDNKFDLIVAGTKGHGVLDELLMGSVTRNLVSLSHVPVLVVKD